MIKSERSKIVIFGGTSGLGFHFAKYLEKKGYEIIIIGRTKNKQKKNIKFHKCDFTKKKDLEKIKKILIKFKLVKLYIFAIGDNYFEDEIFPKLNLLNKIMNINLNIPIELTKQILDNKKGGNKFLHILSDSIFNLKAKPSKIISKGALFFYIKSCKFLFEKTNNYIYGLAPGPLLFKDSYWDKIKKKDPNKFKSKKGKFKAPKDYYITLDKILDKTISNTKIFT